MMEQILIGILVIAAALYLAMRFKNYIQSTKTGTGGCGSGCGCSGKTPEEKTKILAIPLKRK